MKLALIFIMLIPVFCVIALIAPPWQRGPLVVAAMLMFILAVVCLAVRTTVEKP